MDLSLSRGFVLMAACQSKCRAEHHPGPRLAQNSTHTADPNSIVKSLELDSPQKGNENSLLDPNQECYQVKQ
jgi:hypothetical protein